MQVATENPTEATAPTAAPTADELRARLEEIETEMRTLATKRELLTERAREKSAAAAEHRREIMQMQLGERPDEKAMKATRAQLVDCEADASTAQQAAAAIGRTIEELKREYRQTECGVAIADYTASEEVVRAANAALADAILRCGELTEEPTRALRKALDDQSAACSSAFAVLRQYGEQDRVPHPDIEAPFFWRKTYLHHTLAILEAVAVCRASRGDRRSSEAK